MRAPARVVFCLRHALLAASLAGAAGPAASFTLSYTTGLDFEAGIQYVDTGFPLPPPVLVSPSYFAPLHRLHPALAPLLQKVEIEVSAANSNRVNLTNQSFSNRTLVYSLDESMTLRLADPALPAIGPVNSTAVNHSGSLFVPFGLSTSVPAAPGSSLAHLATFTGAQALQFAGPGTFGLEFFDTLGFSVSATPDTPADRENGSAFSRLAGSATVTYTLAEPAAPMALTFSTPLDFLGAFAYDTLASANPPTSGVSPSYFAPLQLLPPALAPLLQKVEITVAAENTNGVSLTNAAPVQRTLSYTAQEQLTVQLADPAFPAVGPLTSAPASRNNSVALAPFFVHFEPATPGSSLDQLVSFTGAPAQQFVGDGTFSLEFFDTFSFSISGDPDQPGYHERGQITSDLSGTAFVTYYLGPRSADVPAPGTLALLVCAVLGLGMARRYPRCTRAVIT